MPRIVLDFDPDVECCQKVATALRSDDPRPNDPREEYPRLIGSIEELGNIAARAGERGARIRITS